MTSSHHVPKREYTCYNGAYKEKRPREQADLIKCVVVGLESATRLHEVAPVIRGSECHGEYDSQTLYLPGVTMGMGCKEVGNNLRRALTTL